MYRYTGRYLGKWLTIAALLGITGGLSAVILKEGIYWVEKSTTTFPLWMAPLIGGILVSIIYSWDHRVSGNGTDRYILTVNERDGAIPLKTAISKLLATIASLGFRGSGGVEGPMLVIGSSLAN